VFVSGDLVLDISGIFVILLCMLGLVGHFFLVSLAYKKSRLWGLAVFLLSPIAAIIFSKKHWTIAKKPFLVYVISFCLTIGLSINMLKKSIDTQLAKVARQTRLAQNNEGPQNMGLSKKVLENLNTLEMALDAMSKQSEGEEDQKYIRLISEYIHYKKKGFTDRSRRYISRNIKELLLLPGLDAAQRTRLHDFKNDLERKKMRGVVERFASSSEKTGPDQVVTLRLSDSRVSIDTRPPVLFSPKSKSEMQQENLGPSSFIEKIPGDIKVKGLRPERERPVYISPTKKISFEQARHYIGSQITFTDLNDIQQTCFLVGFSSKGLECEKRFTAGTFSTQYSRSEVKSLSVFRN